jgi:nitrosocyanin
VKRGVKRGLSFAAVAVAAVALAACGNGRTEHLRVTEVLINGKPGFSIGTVTVTKGDKVDLRIDNSLPAPHGFSIDAYDIHRVVQPHKPQEFSFKATKAGTFRVYCQLHPAHQPATLLVVE